MGSAENDVAASLDRFFYMYEPGFSALVTVRQRMQTRPSRPSAAAHLSEQIKDPAQPFANRSAPPALIRSHWSGPLGARQRREAKVCAS